MLIDILKKINARFFCVFLFFSNFTWALLPPNEVYRLDFRGPDQIFINGFSSWGNNIELLTHVIGDSSRDRTDGLISTTSNWGSVRQIAMNLLIPTDVDEPLYIYTIRPSDSFYDVNGSLIHANIINSGSRISGQSMYAYLNFGWQEEFASVGSIPTQQIREVQVARRVENPDGTANVVIDSTGIANANYVNGTPSININYINATRDIQDLPVYTFGDIRRNPVQASFDIDGCIDSGVDRVIPKKPECLKISYSDYQKATMLKMYVWGII